jgi:hypothetical protein
MIRTLVTTLGALLYTAAMMSSALAAMAAEAGVHVA